jgi:hypothetical protein
MTVRSMVKKDRLYPMKPLSRDQFNGALHRIRSLAGDTDCLFVNGQMAFNEIVGDDPSFSVDWLAVADGFRRIDPPHEKLWIEGTVFGERIAFCAKSQSRGSNYWQVTVDVIATAGGAVAGLYGTVRLEIKDHVLASPLPELSASVPAGRLIPWLTVYLTTVQMMHCRNVVLIDEAAPRGVCRPPHLERPGTFWKTIVIRPDEQIRRSGGDVFSDESKGLVRLHWVRGHYRHFKDGSMCYVMPHQRGNPELGRTIPEYKVAR